MYHLLEARFRDAIEAFLRRRYQVDLPVVVERPPRLEMGELATPVAFELAKRLRRAPRQIAQEIAAELGPIEGVARLEPAGGGYLNAFLGRADFLALALGSSRQPPPEAGEGAAKTIIEHTSINPNKAAHIGHLRNAALGDTFVRLVRLAGRRVQVQNYIDNTGVQVADVVLGFLHLEQKTPAEVRALAAEPRFDFLCWDLYARVTEYLEADRARLGLRASTLRAIEDGHGAEAETAEIVSTAILRCHLRTMQRLGVQYDLLARESDILRLKFWEAAFGQMAERGVITRPSSGKYAGCWVMALAGAPAEAGEEAEAKVIVRSNGTVTYVGKDIAYQLWKFGLLGLDFRYRRFFGYPGGHTVWTTTAADGESGAPDFGHAAEVYNVIDSRQAYLQNVVSAALDALGFHDAAAHSIHFSYEMVALTPRCASELGYDLPPEDAGRPYVEVSGRRGLGVKADDLVDKLEAAARAEVDQRHPEEPAAARAEIARVIALGALRYFLLKYARNTVIAFDFHDALSFEGETGPYVQYAVVRARNIFRKLAAQDPCFPLDRPDALASAGQRAALLRSPEGDEFWELILLAGSLGSSAAASLASQEPAVVAKFAFQLAQAFNVFYHRHHILSEPDSGRKAFLVEMTALVERQLVAALDLLGIAAPEKM
ncbi:MAG TPA: arginine--tRNA ligase [Candidatus Acidoferrales bacterium]|nr:arginine--tRNA ligase [Candidatus Acidoferrales bacterium]